MMQEDRANIYQNSKNLRSLAKNESRKNLNRESLSSIDNREKPSTILMSSINQPENDPQGVQLDNMREFMNEVGASRHISSI